MHSLIGIIEGLGQLVDFGTNVFLIGCGLLFLMCGMAWVHSKVVRS